MRDSATHEAPHSSAVRPSIVGGFFCSENRQTPRGTLTPLAGWWTYARQNQNALIGFPWLDHQLDSVENLTHASGRQCSDLFDQL